ncbi:hypothetical protein BD779DRAFT_1548985 [Infundibulicybe gibba]|nr:hypothetical protein BD779DRAFT_1548985 [Infundibulicybe gibba]
MDSEMLEPAPTSTVQPRALSSRQERKLLDFLDERFLSLTRGYKKRSEPTTHLPTLATYLRAAQQILILILQIPPIDPSTSLRTALLLRLTNDVLNSIPGYPPDVESLPVGQIWDPHQGAGVDLKVEVGSGARSSMVSVTESTRLRTLEEWVSDKRSADSEDVEDMLGRLGVQDGFDELFSRTLDELGGLAGGIVVEPMSIVE